MRTLLIVAVVLGATGCRESGEGSAGYDATWDAQAEVYDRQTERIDIMLDAQELQHDRYEKLLTKWEEQVRRMDAVLEAQEKQTGIKP